MMIFGHLSKLRKPETTRAIHATGRKTAAVLLACLSLIAPSVHADSNMMPSLTVFADHQILVFAQSAATRAVLTAAASGYTPTDYKWERVPDKINTLDAVGRVTFKSSSRNGAAVVATFSSIGVYQIKVTASDTTQQLSKMIWINVWDNRDPLQGEKPIGMYPDVSPPDVRTISQDPGPFQHPRVLFGNQDWPEIHQRDTAGTVASYAALQLRRWTKSTIYDPSTPIGQLADQLDMYARGGYAGAAPDMSYVLSHSALLASRGHDSFFSELYCASYIQWLEHDPTIDSAKEPPDQQSNGRFLANITAAAAKIYLDQVWNRQTGRFNTSSPYFQKSMALLGYPVQSDQFVDLAMSYDMIYKWMTPAQQVQVRDFLYAMSYDRHASNGFETNGPYAGKPREGSDQNGDFGNLSDDLILVEMAIEGEEGAVSPDVKKQFGTAAPGSLEANWMKPANPDDPAAWPNATQAAVDNLQRELMWLQDWFVSPWGFTVNYTAYFSFSAKYTFPAMYAAARHNGENLFVTSYLYPATLAVFYPLAPGEAVTKGPLGQSSMYLWDHHDSMAFDYRGTDMYLWKYMYPNDAMVDYSYRAYLPTACLLNDVQDPMIVAIFGMDPGVHGHSPTLPEVAQDKRLPLLKFDPQRGIVAARNSWNENDASLWFDCASDATTGHMHAEKNSFAFFALGRAWSIAPGYHVTVSDAQSSVLIQNPLLLNDTASQGYIGESPSSATSVPPLPGNFPTPPGRMVDVKEDPKHQWALMCGDASACYNLGFKRGSLPKIDTGMPLKSFMWAGVFDALVARQPRIKDELSQHLTVTQNNYNPVQYAFRTVLFVRGARPYVLIVDDIKKDDNPHNYRWNMNDSVAFAPGSDLRFVDANGKGVYSDLAIEPGATTTNAVLYHSPIDDEKMPAALGLPRLIVRDVSENANTGQPLIFIDSRPPGAPMAHLTVGIDNNTGKPDILPSCRLEIERDNVVEPKYKVLLFPYRTGQPIPVTRWNTSHTKLWVNLENGTVDTITFDRTNPDHRTRVEFSRETTAGNTR